MFTRSSEFINRNQLKDLLKNHSSVLTNDSDYSESNLLKAILNNLRRKPSDNLHTFTPKYIDCSLRKRGRHYCKKGLAGLSRKTRNYLSDNIYYDVDISNCVYSFLNNYAIVNGLCNTKINKYINHREKKLKTLMDQQSWTRDEAKNYYTKKCFSYIENPKTSVETEIKNIQEHLLSTDDAKEILDAKTKNIINESKGFFNMKGKVISELYFEYEMKIIKSSIKFMKDKEYHVCTDLHDGFYVLKDNVAIDKLQNDLVELNIHIKELMNHNIEFKIKPMTEKHNIEFVDGEDLKEQQSENYSVLKKKFEKDVCKIDCQSKYLIEDHYHKSFILKSKADLIIQFEDWYPANNLLFCEYAGGDKGSSFIKNWLLDPNKRKYVNIDFIPSFEECPDTIYNIFRGFEVANIIDNTITEKDTSDFELILSHLKYICDDGTDMKDIMYNYIIDWIAHIFQKPTEKTNTCLIFKGIEGSGKSIICDFIGKLLGNQYFYSTADPLGDLFGNFNSVAVNKMLINFDETEKKDSANFYEKFKNLITTPDRTLKEKFVKEITVKDYTRYIMTTNNQDCIKFSDTNRRFVAIECSQKKKSQQEFFNLVNAFNNQSAQKLFYDMLMDRNIEECIWSDIPKTKYYYRALDNSRDPLLDFLEENVHNEYTCFKGLLSVNLKDFYAMYESFMKSQKLFPVKQKDFKNNLLETGIFSVQKTKTGLKFVFSKETYISELTNKGYVIGDFINDDEE
jgi:hypothetical protein